MTDPERAPLTVVHSSGRAGGKTYQAVAWVLEQDDRVLVVLNGSHRQAVIESWPAMRATTWTVSPGDEPPCPSDGELTDCDRGTSVGTATRTMASWP